MSLVSWLTKRVMTMVNPNFSGKLFYVIGASGVGKDSLLRYALQRLEGEPVVFAHRYITRPVELQGENHIQLSEAEFKKRLDQGCFKFDWQSHGLHYGVGIEVDYWLGKGLNVVMNGSRAYLEDAIAKHPDLITLLVKVEPALLRQRLVERGRENEQQIDKRIQRATEFSNLSAPNMHIIENNNELAVAGDKLIDLLKKTW